MKRLRHLIARPVGWLFWRIEGRPTFEPSNTVSFGERADWSALPMTVARAELQMHCHDATPISADFDAHPTGERYGVRYTYAALVIGDALPITFFLTRPFTRRLHAVLDSVESEYAKLDAVAETKR